MGCLQAWPLVLLALLVTPSPAGAARMLYQSPATSNCPDLVPGAFWESVTEAAPGDAAVAAAFEGAGPIYLVGAAEDGSSPDGPSQYTLQVWDTASNSQAAADASPGSCSTTSVVDFCQQGGGPAAVQIRLQCTNSGSRPCRVRLAAYMSACPGGPQPTVVAVGSSSSGSSSSSTSGAAEDPSASVPPASAPSMPALQPESGSSSGSSSSGTSTQTWVILGASLGAALLLVVLLMWWCCRRRRRQRPPADLESGGHPPLPPGKQQQFLVSGGSSSGQQQQPKWQPQQHQGAAAVPLPLSAHAAGGAAPVAQDWAFAYKVAAQRLTFATDSSRRTAQPQRWERVDDWLAAAVVRSTEQRWDGCLLYNDDPPEAFPDGSPTGYTRPAPYKPCGHTKGVVLWGAGCIGWLVHSLPCWPCHDRSAPSGVGGRLSEVQDSQTDRGQSFLFTLLPRSALPAVLQQLLHMQALVYFASDRRLWPYEPRDYTKPTGQGFRSVQLGPGMWHLGKANEPTANLYQRLSEEWGGMRWWLRTNLIVKDKERNQVPSTAMLVNISTLQVPGFDHRTYQSGSEHAKMAVCVGRREGDQPGLLMVGDLNNTYPQWRRGGGGLVLQHPLLWQLLRLMAVDVGEP